MLHSIPSCLDNEVLEICMVRFGFGVTVHHHWAEISLRHHECIFSSQEIQGNSEQLTHEKFPGMVTFRSILIAHNEWEVTVSCNSAKEHGDSVYTAEIENGCSCSKSSPLSIHRISRVYIAVSPSSSPLPTISPNPFASDGLRSGFAQVHGETTGPQGCPKKNGRREYVDDM